MSERSPSNSENNIGELPKINKLIIMDDVSGFADKSEDFSNFLFLENMVFRVYMFFMLFIQVDKVGK